MVRDDYLLDKWNVSGMPSDFNLLAADSLRHEEEEEDVASKMTRQNQTWICLVCSYSSIQKRHITEHIIGKHGKNYNIPCPKCLRTYKNIISLKAHIRRGLCGGNPRRSKKTAEKMKDM